MLKVILFYKYTRLEKPEDLKRDHLEFCSGLGIRGRILVAHEGINGSVSGTADQIEAYKKALSNDSRFKGIEFKEDSCLMHPFKTMKIKIKPELVRFEQEVNFEEGGKHLSPKEFLEMAQQENVVIVDARNAYESKIGKFKNAITPEISTFREFPKILPTLEDKKDKKILMYCTGGIRCEKASAFLKKEGFSNVYQLHGGILNFGKECPDTIWEGSCFVFDKRLQSSINLGEERPISNCAHCDIPCDLIKNCRNKSCDEFVVICISCEQRWGGCCSEKCYQFLFENRPKQAPLLDITN